MLFIPERELQLLFDELVAEQSRDLRLQKVNQLRELVNSMARMLQLQAELSEARSALDDVSSDIVGAVASRLSRVRIVEKQP